MALDRVGNAKLGAVVGEDLAVFGFTPATERVREYVEVGGDPFRLPLEPKLDLRCCEVARHLQPDLVAGAAVLEQVKTSRRISFPGDLLTIPGWAPEIPCDDMGEELEVCDVEVLEVGRGTAGDVFICREVENAESGEPIEPPIRTGIFGDVGGGGEVEEGDAVTQVKGLNPPVKILEEGSVKDNGET